MTTDAVSRFETAALTHPGKLRASNEDSFLNQTASGLWAVADGMGGHQRGDFASQSVIDALRQIEPQHSAANLLAQCETCVAAVNERLAKAAAEQQTTIGTTLVLLLTFGRHYACIWTGDSRVYLVRQGQIAMVSHDHTEVQNLVDLGVMSMSESRASPMRNIVTRALGVSERAELELAQGQIQDKDAFLLCSDGLTEHVFDEELCAIITSRSCEEACHLLVNLALERGGTDNVTAIVIRYHESEQGRTKTVGLDWAEGVRGGLAYELDESDRSAR